MKKDIQLSNGNSLSVQIDDRKKERQAFVQEVKPGGIPACTTHFTTRHGLRELDGSRFFDELTDEAFNALNDLGEGSFIIP